MAHRKKDIEANPIVYDGLIYVPTPGNLSLVFLKHLADKIIFQTCEKII